MTVFKFDIDVGRSVLGETLFGKGFYYPGETQPENEIGELLTQIIGELLTDFDLDIEKIKSLYEKAGGHSDDPNFRIIKSRYSILELAWKREFKQAKELIIHTLTSTEESGVEPWLVRDIALDGRNILREEINLGLKDLAEVGKPSIFKEKLDSLEPYNIFPYIDRELFNAFEGFSREYSTISTDSAFTTRLGGELRDTLEHLSIALCYAVIFGSYSFIRITYNHVIDLLVSYCGLQKDPYAGINALKLAVLSNDSKRVKDILDLYWPILYPEVLLHNSDLFEIVRKKIPTPDCITTHNRLAYELGPYLPDDERESLNEVLLKYTQEKTEMNVRIDVGRSAVEALSKNTGSRFISKYKTDVMAGIKSADYLALDTYLEWLAAVDWGDVDDNVAREYASAISERLDKELPLRNALRTLEQIDRKVPSGLGEINENVLERAKKDPSNLLLVWYCGAAIDEINGESARGFVDYLTKQLVSLNEESKSGGPITVHPVNKATLIAAFLIKKAMVEDEAINGIVGGLFLSLLENERATIGLKVDVLDACLILLRNGPEFYKNIPNYVSESLKNGLPKSKVMPFDGFFITGSEKVLDLKLNELLLETGFINNKKFLSFLYDPGEFKDISFASNIPPVLRSFSKRRWSLSERYLIMSVLLDLTHHDVPSVRAHSLYTLWLYAHNNRFFKNAFAERLAGVLEDYSSYVRSSAVFIAGKALSVRPKDKAARRFLKAASKDRHFGVRNEALSVLEKFN